MAKTTKSAAVIGLHLVKTEDRGFGHGNYTHFALYPVVIGRTPYELRELDNLGNQAAEVPAGRIRNISCSYDSDLVNGLDLDSLRIWSQGGGYANTADNARLYGWEIGYHDVYSVDRYRANRMAKTMNAIDKRMEKDREKHGRPKTFGQYVASVAKAIGATKLVIGENKHGWDTIENDRRIVDFPGSAIDHIDYQVDQWAESVRQKATV